MALRGVARGAAVADSHPDSYADPDSHPDAVHLVFEPAAGAGARFVVVRVRLVVRVFVRSRG